MKLYLAFVRFLTHPVMGLLFRLVVGGVYLYASYDKILHPEVFVRFVHNYRILPPALETLFALILPSLEFLIGLFLVFGVLTEASALLTSGTLIMFLIAIASALLRHIDIECGCFFTAKSARIGMSYIYRDLLLLIPTLLILFRPSRFLALDRLIFKPKRS